MNFPPLQQYVERALRAQPVVTTEAVNLDAGLKVPSSARLGTGVNAATVQSAPAPTPGQSPARPSTRMGAGGGSAGVAAAPVWTSNAYNHPAMSQPRGPSLAGAASDAFHAGSGRGTGGRQTAPYIQAAEFNAGDIGRMTDSQKSQWAAAVSGKAHSTDWTQAKQQNAGDPFSGTVRSKELIGGIAKDPRTGAHVNAGTDAIGQVTERVGADGVKNVSISTPYGSGSNNVGGPPVEKRLTDNGVTTTGAGAFQKQLQPMQQQQAQNYATTQRTNEMTAAGMSPAMQRGYNAAAPAAGAKPYNDGLPEHPALAPPSAATQRGMASLTQSNLPPAPPAAPPAAPKPADPFGGGQSAGSLSTLKPTAPGAATSPVAAATPKPPAATPPATLPAAAPKPAVPAVSPKMAATQRPNNWRRTQSPANDWRRVRDLLNVARAVAPERKAIPSAPAFRSAPSTTPAAGYLNPNMAAFKALPQELKAIGMSMLPAMLPLS